MLRKTVLAAAFTAALTPAAFAASQDIVDIAAGAGDFTTLVAAVEAADLVDVLKSDGPFTVFAGPFSLNSACTEGVLA